MRFELDADQRALVELTDEVLRKEEGSPERTWKALVDSGVLGAVLPESVGGSGLGAFEAGLILHAVGKSGVALPALGSLMFGAVPLASFAEPDPLLYWVATEGIPLTAAIGEPGQPFPDAPSVITRWDEETLLVTGSKVNVPDLDAAQWLLVVVAHQGEPTLVLVDPTGPGVRTGPLGAVRLEDAVAERVIGGPDRVRALYRHAVAGTVAFGSGSLDGALGLTVEHTGTREQFGRPIATFQAAAAELADVAVTARSLRLIANSACWRLGRELDADTDIATAAFWFGTRALEAVHTCHHLHGGVGVDIDYPLHRHYGAVKRLTGLLGGEHAVTEAMGVTV